MFNRFRGTGSFLPILFRKRTTVLGKAQPRRSNPKATPGPARSWLGKSRSSYISVFAGTFRGPHRIPVEARFQKARALLRRLRSGLGRPNFGTTGYGHRRFRRRGSDARRDSDRLFHAETSTCSETRHGRALGGIARRELSSGRHAPS